MTVQQQSQPAAAERTEQDDPGAGASALEKAQGKKKENEDAAEEMRVLEQGEPPTDLDDWPDGPANLERFADGSITIDGEKVDKPDDYKGEPLAGGPTDPNALSR